MSANVNQTTNKALNSAKNLSDVTSVSSARTNLSIYSQAEVDLAIANAIVAANPANARAEVAAATNAALSAYTGTGTGILTMTGMTGTFYDLLFTDNYSLSDGQRFLVKDQTGGLALDNGIYDVSGTGVQIVLTRSADSNTALKLPVGAFNFVQHGDVNAGGGFVILSFMGALGVDSINYIRFTGENIDETAGTGLIKTGNAFNIKYPGTAISINGADLNLTLGNVESLMITIDTLAGGGTDQLELPAPYGLWSVIGYTPFVIKDISGSPTDANFIRVAGPASQPIDDSGDVTPLTSGLLVVGIRYFIGAVTGSDDFTNVGFATPGTPFIATGTTPTVWTNSTNVYSVEGIKITVPYGSLQLFTNGSKYFTI